MSQKEAKPGSVCPLLSEFLSVYIVLFTRSTLIMLPYSVYLFCLLVDVVKLSVPVQAIDSEMNYNVQPRPSSVTVSDVLKSQLIRRNNARGTIYPFYAKSVVKHQPTIRSNIKMNTISVAPHLSSWDQTGQLLILVTSAK